jgi:Aerotolerance regulator N-terminal
LLQLLQPIWLFALAGLSVPVIIHLWNRRPGKILRVGSIALVTASTAPDKRNMRLQDILLLLLRCLLLSVIALALAAPVWHSRVNASSKGWVLMNRVGLRETYQHFKPRIDELLQAGMEFHYFEDSFRAEKIEKALEQSLDSPAFIKSNYRALVASLDQQLDAGTPVYIYTDNYLRNFEGTRTAVSLNLHWSVFTPKAANAIPPADSSSLKITICSKQYSNDARYLKAAFDAVQQFSKRNINTVLVSNPQQVAQDQDWLFWLDDAPAPSTTARHIVQYVKGEAVSNTSWIIPGSLFPAGAIDLYRSVKANDSISTGNKILWQDGFGNPLLACNKQDGAAYYSLYTHIDPAWNELPWSDNFPAWLFTWLYGKEAGLSLADTASTAVIDSSQLLQLQQPAGATTRAASFKTVPLQYLGWLMAVLLFFAERWVSFYQQKAKRND